MGRPRLSLSTVPRSPTAHLVLPVRMCFDGVRLCNDMGTSRFDFVCPSLRFSFWFHNKVDVVRLVQTFSSKITYYISYRGHRKKYVEEDHQAFCRRWSCHQIQMLCKRRFIDSNNATGNSHGHAMQANPRRDTRQFFHMHIKRTRLNAINA